jgi:excisionase family DNA binding protein
MTPAELARLLRVSIDRVRGWIASGRLAAVNTAKSRCDKPRYVVLPHHLAEFERLLGVAPPAKPVHRRRRPVETDYYPD